MLWINLQKKSVLCTLNSMITKHTLKVNAEISTKHVFTLLWANYSYVITLLWGNYYHVVTLLWGNRRFDLLFPNSAQISQTAQTCCTPPGDRRYPPESPISPQTGKQKCKTNTGNDLTDAHPDRDFYVSHCTKHVMKQI